MSLHGLFFHVSGRFNPHFRHPRHVDCIQEKNPLFLRQKRGFFSFLALCSIFFPTLPLKSAYLRFFVLDMIPSECYSVIHGGALHECDFKTP